MSKTKWSCITDYKAGKRRMNITWIHCSIIIIMCIIVLSSLICSVSIHILGSSFDWHKIFSAKFAFTPRVIENNEIVLSSSFMSSSTSQKLESNPSTSSLLVTTTSIPSSTLSSLPLSVPSNLTISQLNTTVELEKKTQKPKVIKHIYRISSDSETGSNSNENTDDTDADKSNEASSTTKYIEDDINKNDYEDQIFLSTMQLDLRRIRWGSERLLNYIVYYPYFSEIVAIVWAVMTLIYQSGNKVHWTVPAPWRIVVPSLAVFFVMAIISFCSTLVAHNAVNNFCDELRSGLKNINSVPCGDAILHFRLENTNRKYEFQRYIDIFHAFNIMQTICWILALCVMLIRFFLAIDFQLIETAAETVEPRDYDSELNDITDNDLVDNSEDDDDDDNDGIISDIMYSNDQLQFNTIGSRSTSQTLPLKTHHDDDEDFYSTKSHVTNETNDGLSTFHLV